MHLKQIGCGYNTNIWNDQWLPALPTYEIMSDNLQNSLVNLVADLKQGEQWNDHLDEFFTQAAISAIKDIQIREVPSQNRWVWQ